MSRMDDDLSSITSDLSIDDQYSSSYTPSRNELGSGMNADNRSGSGKNTDNRAESVYREFLQLIKQTEHFMTDINALEVKQGSLRIAYSDMSTKVEIVTEELEELLDVLDGVDLKMKTTMSGKYKAGMESLAPLPSFKQGASRSASSEHLDRLKNLDRVGAPSPMGSDILGHYSDDMDDNLSQNLDGIDDDDF